MNDTLCQNIHAARRKTRKIQGNSRHCKMLVEMGLCGSPWPGSTRYVNEF